MLVGVAERGAGAAPQAAAVRRETTQKREVVVRIEVLPSAGCSTTV
jgi:hypothetical protein